MKFKRGVFALLGVSALSWVMAPNAFSFDVCSIHLESKDDFLSRIHHQFEEPESTALVRYDPKPLQEDVQRKLRSLENPKRVSPPSMAEIDSVLDDLLQLSRMMEGYEHRAPWAKEILKSRKPLFDWAEESYFSVVSQLLKSQKIETKKVVMADGHQALQVISSDASKVSRVARHLSEDVGVRVHFGARNIAGNVLGYFSPHYEVVVVNHNMIIVPKSGFRTLLHETRHAQYFGKRLNSEDSLFHGYFKIIDEGQFLSKSPIYNQYMSLEEVMTHSLDTRVIGDWFRKVKLDNHSEVYDILRNFRGKARNSAFITDQTIELMSKFRSASEVLERDVSVQFYKNDRNPKMNKVLWLEMSLGSSVLRLPLVKSEHQQWADEWLKLTAERKDRSHLLKKLNTEFRERVSAQLELNIQLKSVYDQILRETDAPAKTRGFVPTIELIDKWMNLSQIPRRLTLEFDRRYQPGQKYRID